MEKKQNQNSKFELSFARLISVKLEGYSPEQAGVMIDRIFMSKWVIFMLFVVVLLFVVLSFKFPAFISHLKPFFL